MLKSGVQKNRYKLSDYSHEKSFGSLYATLDVSKLPDEYNADLGLSFPDQNQMGIPNGCTGLTQSEIGQDENGELFDAEKLYRDTLLIEDQPFGAPCQIRDSFKATRTTGLKRKNSDTTLVRGAYYDVDKNGDYFDGARSALWLNNIHKRTISAGSPWFHEWLYPINGILPSPKKYIWDSNTPGHNYKICGWTTIQNLPYLILKPWRGIMAEFWGWLNGEKGYNLVAREIFNKTMNISGTFMYIQSNLTPDEVKRVKLDIWQLILQFFLRNPSKLHIDMPPEAPTSPATLSKAQKLYKTSFACIGRNMRSGDAPQEFGCVDAFRGVWREAFGNDIAPGVLNTNGLDAVLSKIFKPVTEDALQPGDIQIALTEGDVHGHVLIRGKQDSMSNDSSTGLWKANYHNANVQLVFRDTLHLKINYYRPVNN